MTMTEHGAWAECPKCGRRKLGALRYIRGVETLSAGNPHTIRGEHLDRECKACGYKLCEPCKDATALDRPLVEAQAPRVRG